MPIDSSPPAEHIIQAHEAELASFCGRNDSRLREIEREMGVKVVVRGSMMKILGEAEPVSRTATLLGELLDVFRHGAELPPQRMRYAIHNARSPEGQRHDIKAIFTDFIEVPLHGKRVAPMTANQKRYVEALRQHDVVFGIGPAGTGKTYLAVAAAVSCLVAGVVRRIVLVRPAVEAGERLGFLPGDIAQKFDPYVRPLYDALHDMMETERVKSYLESGIIELAPLAFMRGRTLNDAFVILDEGQNTSVEQMKMFLTRLGFGSRMVVTGDVTQVDLSAGKLSGLVHAREALAGVPGIAFVEFGKSDIVRHTMVQNIIHAYDEYQQTSQRDRERQRGHNDADAD